MHPQGIISAPRLLINGTFTLGCHPCKWGFWLGHQGWKKHTEDAKRVTRDTKQCSISNCWWHTETFWNSSPMIEDGKVIGEDTESSTMHQQRWQRSICIAMKLSLNQWINLDAVNLCRSVLKCYEVYWAGFGWFLILLAGTVQFLLEEIIYTYNS